MLLLNKLLLFLVLYFGIVECRYKYGNSISTSNIKTSQKASETILILSDETKRYISLSNIINYLEKEKYAKNEFISDYDIDTVKEINNVYNMYFEERNSEDTKKYSESFIKFYKINKMVEILNEAYPEVVKEENSIMIKNNYLDRDYNDFTEAELNMFLQITQNNLFFLLNLEKNLNDEIEEYNPNIFQNYIENIRNLYVIKSKFNE